MRGLLGCSMLALAACPPAMTQPTDSGASVECSGRAECSAGLICVESRCTGCESSGQCSVKEVCSPDGGVCALREGWGTDCASNDDCQAGSWCKQGLCLERAAVSLCPLGNSSECPQGERCNRTSLVCEEDLGCSTNDDCGAMEVCNTGSRQCSPRCTVETQGTVCAAGERCADDGLCVQCTGDAECGAGLTCDAARRCVAGMRCYTDRDCKVPLTCFVATGACLPKPPPCLTNDNCSADQRCDVRRSRCVPKTCQPDRYEPNETSEKAFGVTTGTLTDLTLCQGDVDWYATNLNRGDQVGVIVDADPFSENNFSTVIKDPGGRTVAGGRFLVSHVAASMGTYYVVVSTIDPYQLYDVTFLRARGTPCDDDSREPNDTPVQATQLNASRTSDGKVCPQDSDYFQPTVPMGKGLRARLINYDASKGLLNLCVVSADGQTELFCSDAPSPVVTLTSTQLGVDAVLVRVSGSTERISNVYTLEVEYP